MNGYNIRYGSGGGSGTDTSTILVAEYLASIGHEVVYTIDELEPLLQENHIRNGNVFTPGSSVNGVVYTYKNFEGVKNKTFDLLVSMLWFNDYNKLPIKVTKGFIYWSHMQWIYGVGEIVDFCSKNNLKVGIVNISKWEQKMNNSVIDFIRNKFNNLQQTIISNPITDDLVKKVYLENIPRKKQKFIFHASWARGGNIAYNAIKSLELKNKEYHVFDYLMTINDYKDDWFYKHDSVDKYTLFKHLAESEYFVYPLYTPYKDVHKDTFSCVVAEAIAMGCLVLTYPLGALPELYNDYCIWLDFPPNSNPEIMQNEPLSKDEAGVFKYTDNIKDKITYLEENPKLKEDIIKNGKEYILDNFSISNVGKNWEDFINKLIYEVI
jgi:glycosyltransferase involved in cell wall biosynthesis